MIKMGSCNPHKEKQVYWCEICDNEKVDSENEDTGIFFQVFGHEFQTDDSTSVFFAVCKNCLPNFEEYMLTQRRFRKSE